MLLKIDTFMSFLVSFSLRMLLKISLTEKGISPGELSFPLMVNVLPVEV
jgi:hypothetical protein